METQTETASKTAMGCYEHPDKTVVATCPKCGKFMCKECAEKYESKLCQSCEEARVKEQKENLKNNSKNYFKSTKKQLTGIIIKSVILAIIGFSLGGGTNEIETSLICAYLFAAFPWGWKIIKQLIDDGVLSWFFLASDGLFIFAVIMKFALSIIVGAVAFPISLILAIKDFTTAKKIDENVNK